MSSDSTVARCAGLVAVLGPEVGCGDDGSSPTVRFESPDNGARVVGGLEVAMFADGVDTEPAGEVHPGAGHFHVIADGGCAAAGTGIAKDVDHVHFGGGQTTGFVYLSPGPHTLCLQVGDGVHTATDLTDQLTIDVGIDDQAQWCTVLEEVHLLFESVTVDSPEDFPVSQAIHSNILRLLEQLDAGHEFVDIDAVDEVRATIGVASTFAHAMQEADDLVSWEDAFRLVDVNDMSPGADWMLSSCGIDIDGSGRLG